eukprot:5518504-Prymnesium_polylepis.1
MAKFTRLVWSLDWDTSLRRLLTQPVGQMAFQQWLQNNAPMDVTALELIVEVTALDALDPEAAQEEACQLCEQFMGQTSTDGKTALLSLRDQAARMIHSLAAESFPKFVQSKAVSARPQPVSDPRASAPVLPSSEDELVGSCLCNPCVFATSRAAVPAAGRATAEERAAAQDAGEPYLGQVQGSRGLRRLDPL